jgi:hypothetical protein
MNRLAAIARLLALAVLGVSAAHAQWKTEDYVLKAGWNGIYLHGDASYATPAQLFQAYPAVTQVWRWNPNPDQIQFSTSPAVPDATSSEWTIWNRKDPAEQQLTKMIGQSAYLVYWDVTVAPATTAPVRIAQKPMPPAATWLITGANFMGFPADPASSTTTFANYFASFPVAITTPTKIYKYVGGELGLANPMEVTAFGNEKVDRNTAYWFQAATVGNFTGLVEYELPSNAGLAFGRTAVSLTVGVMNRSNAAVTLTISTQPSEADPTAPAGQTGIAGSVPITRRVLDSTTGAYTDTPIVGSFSVTIAANGRMDLQFGIDRGQLTGSASALYASLLRIKDSAKFTDVFIPITAQKATPAGLWVGTVNVKFVGVVNVKSADGKTTTNIIAGQPGTTTARAFPLRLLIHVDGDGKARVLSQAFVGNLAADGHAPGICIDESGLWADTKANALRLVSSQMPILGLPIDGASFYPPDNSTTPPTPPVPVGAFTVRSTLTYTVSLPFNDPTNPFVHTYHPDHDNLDARFKPYEHGDGVESYTVTRHVTLTFTPAPPDGSTVSGWGTTVYGGTYFETITGLNRQTLTVAGGFGMRRVSEVADLDTTITP